MAENKSTLLRSVIASHFEVFLNRYGFKENSYSYDRQSFGNEILNLSSPTFILRFSADRGCLGIDGRPVADSRWVELSLFLEFLGYPFDYANIKNYQGIVSAEDLAPVYAPALEAHFETVVDLLQPNNIENTWRQFDAFLSSRAKRLYGTTS